MLDARNKMLEGKYEIITGLPLGARSVESVSVSPPFAQLLFEDHVWFEDRWMVASLCDE
jgi:hypothetical protein